MFMWICIELQSSYSNQPIILPWHNGSTAVGSDIEVPTYASCKSSMIPEIKWRLSAADWHVFGRSDFFRNCLSQDLAYMLVGTSTKARKMVFFGLKSKIICLRYEISHNQNTYHFTLLFTQNDCLQFLLWQQIHVLLLNLLHHFLSLLFQQGVHSGPKQLVLGTLGIISWFL